MENNEEKMCPKCGAFYSQAYVKHYSDDPVWECVTNKKGSPEDWYKCYFCDVDLVSKDEFQKDTLDPEAVSRREKAQDRVLELYNIRNYRSCFGYGVSYLVFAILNILLTNNVLSDLGIITVACWILTIILFIICFLFLCIGLNNYSVMQKDPDSYNKYIKIKDAEEEEMRKRQESIEKQEKNRLEHPQCPTCGSRDTHKISLTARTVSASMIGVASPYVGKTFECNRCGYKW